MTLRRLSLTLALFVAIAGSGVIAFPSPASAAPPSAITVNSTQPTSVYGESVTLQVTITGRSGAPTGTVDILDGGQVICPGEQLEALSSVFSLADCIIPALGVGSHSITAVYSGDGTYDAAPSTDFEPAFTQTVSPAATTTGMSATPDPSAFTEPILLTATVSVTAPGGGIVGGTVEFRDAGAAITNCTARPVSGGTASCSAATLTPGPHDLSAVYSGTTNHLTSTGGPEGHDVTNASTSTTVLADDSTTTWNQTVNFTATVAPVAPATLPPNAGTVRFATDGVTIPGCATRPVASGTATSAAVALPPGTQTITAEFSPGTGFEPSSSPGVGQSVAPAPTGIQLAGDPDPSRFGQDVELTATLTSSAGTPAGTVAFFVVRDDSTRRWIATTTLTAGVASATTSTLPVGNHTIQAVYRGADEYAAKETTILQAVRRAETGTALTSSPDPSPRGRRVSVRATVSATGSGGGSPSGSVAFFRVRADDTRVWLATAELVNRRATVTTTGLPVGEQELIAVYRGSQSHLASSGTKTHTVTAA